MTPRDERPMPAELREALHDTPDAVRAGEMWELLGTLAPAPPPQAAAERQAAWQALQARLAAEPPRVRAIRSPRRYWLAAAVLMLAVGLGVRSAGRSELRTEAGRTARVVLPDGSVAELDGGSRLIWRRNFAGLIGGPDDERVVTLDGTGYFDVRQDGRPFIVQTFNSTVRVLGTRFAVRAWNGEAGGTTVDVAEGRVRVAAKRDSVELVAGQRTEVAAATQLPSAPSAVAPERVALWRTGGFAAVDATLGSIVHELEQHYGVRIQLRNRIASQQRLTLYYPAPSGVQAILADLCTARGLTFRPVRGGYEVE